MKTDEIRQRFLDFFKARSHTIVKSDSLVPQNDPTLLFTGAGMNQFKDYFLGLKQDLTRTASCQKCLRAGDLDEVGRTAYHHSFFEMLGNFSFGDYFKREAILWAWEFITREMAIPREKLRVSVHQSDKEAYHIWKNEVGIPDRWIAKMGDKTNFWPANAPQAGPNGPCGPCSEIYYDLAGDAHTHEGHECSLEDDCGRFSELWNLVFTQFDRRQGGELVPLKKMNIDTGMGLERLACVLQGKRTNFEIDTFRPINESVRTRLGLGRQRDLSQADLYAISDHVRATVFLITDGAIPSNEGRGYVVRKLIRRALWRAHQLLRSAKKGAGQTLEEPFLYSVVPEVVQGMKSAYPELREAESNVRETLKGEEERFLRTLETGLALLREKIDKSKNRKVKVLPGEEVFFLYDTYGFPDELTRVIAAEEGFLIDQKGFDRLMAEQKGRAKEASAMGESIFVTTDFDRTLHKLPTTRFLGYETRKAKSRVLLSKVQGGRGILVLDQTPFYAESGGQVGDQGILKCVGFEARVEDTQKKDQYHLHIVQILKGSVREGSELEAEVDSGRRDAAMRNHTATHLLHAVLREVLGSHVRQLGSLVHPDRLRFDYSSSRPLSREELTTIENRVNEEILKNAPVQKEEKETDQAKKEGALAFFGEKYGDRVRVVSVPGISKEFCGGTHCERTGQIGAFVITTDSSIASGVRRIEALTGFGALQYLQRLRDELQRAAERLRSTPSEVSDRVGKLQEKLKRLEKEGPANAFSQADPEECLKRVEKVAGFGFIAEQIEGTNREALRKISDGLRSRAEKAVWFLLGQNEGRLHFLIALSADLKNSALDAREMAQVIAPLLGGSGGGRKDLSEGGGTRLEAAGQRWPQVKQAIRDYLKSRG